MSNPLFQQMNPQGPVNGMQQMMQRFNRFRQAFTGDPRQQVQQLLNSGRVSQAQYDAAVRMASQFQRMLSGR